MNNTDAMRHRTNVLLELAKAKGFPYFSQLANPFNADWISSDDEAYGHSCVAIISAWMRHTHGRYASIFFNPNRQIWEGALYQISDDIVIENYKIVTKVHYEYSPVSYEDLALSILLSALILLPDKNDLIMEEPPPAA